MVPQGLDPCALRPEQLAVLERNAGPSPWPRTRRAGALGPVGTALALGEAQSDDLDAQQGSNAWVVAPGRSGSGRALLATDPHLPVLTPGPQFISHLKAPGLDAIGSAWVFRPGMQGGHNDRVARGRTDFQMDQEDLYLLELDAAGTAYRVPGGWAPITRVTERIAVRDAPEAEVTVAQTALGPVIFEDRAAHRALALRSAQLQSGPVTSLEYIGVTLARNWAEHQAALRYVSWGSNYFYADVEGNIGWQTGGRMPRRRGHDGLLPVPAAGGFDWGGFLSVEEMVGEFNPPRGWIASGNQMPFPATWPQARRTSWEWIPDDRYRRMTEVLAVQVPHGQAEALALQQDVLSLRARALLPVLATLPDPPAEAALLRGWDGRMTADSEAAAIFAFWWSGLADAVRLAMVPEPLRAALPQLHPQVMLALATGEDLRLGERRLALVGQALEGAAGRRPALGRPASGGVAASAGGDAAGSQCAGWPQRRRWRHIDGALVGQRGAAADHRRGEFPHGGGTRRLGAGAGYQPAGAVRRPAKRALRRPLWHVGGRRDLPAGLWRGGGARGGGIDADPAAQVSRRAVGWHGINWRGIVQ
jgi:penicillin amidase